MLRERVPGCCARADTGAEGCEQTIAGEQGLDTTDSTACADSMVPVNARVAEFTGHWDGTLEEAAAGHERTTDAVSEVEKHEGVGCVGGGLMAERERLDLLDGTEFGPEEAADLR